MAEIFPPGEKGGIPPGPNVVNGYTPIQSVIGEGPLYIAPDCSTVLTDGQLNAITSEILAAVDRLGFSHNTNILTNLGDAIKAAIDALDAAKLNRAGDTMTGPLVLPGDPTADLQASDKHYVDAIVAAATAAITAAYQSGDVSLENQLINKVSRSGDVMTGPLGLSADPTDPLQAATKAYVDAHIGTGGGGGFPDAPFDGSTYGRNNAAWLRVIAESGGVMTGPLSLAADPVNPLDAADKQYVDTTVGHAVRYDQAQALTATQIAQAQRNIYAAPFDAMAFNGLQINGALEVSQERGRAPLTLVNGTGSFILDMWAARYASGVAVFQAGQIAHGDTTTLPMMPDCAFFRATTAMSSVGGNDFAQVYAHFDGRRIMRLGFGTAKAMPLTLAFWVKASIPGTMALSVSNVDGTRSHVIDVPINSANVLEYKTVTVPGDSGGTWLQTQANALFVSMAFACGANFQTPPGAWVNGDKRGTPNTSNFFASATNQVQVTGFSAFAGTQAPSAAQSHLAQRTFDEEIILCTRYYQKSYRYADLPGTVTDAGKSLMMWTAGTGYKAWPITFANRTRLVPTVIPYSSATGTPNRMRDDTNGVDRTANISAPSEVGFSIYTDLGGTACAAMGCQWVADARI